MLRVLFADAGTKDDLLAAISSIRGWARRSRHNAQLIALDYLGGQPPPYPGRTQIVKLTMAYQMSVVTAVERWADWAEAEARTWNDTVTPAEADAPLVLDSDAVQYARFRSYAQFASLRSQSGTRPWRFTRPCVI